ncbi:hypothetical protein [Arenimonas terrae]|uniref:Uncharacterized protein n=1 Tax=Arenimonas terrae TaxID=2546226 RepID=A0A5C4RX03_9GAMM|nr:hypothetical protein [Arenimonas terrae]TNJ35429.1 hypothetical protein E1B00_06645 [Arenimonas terrae]
MAGFFRQLAEQALRPVTHLRSATATRFTGTLRDGADSDDPLLRAMEGRHSGTGPRLDEPSAGLDGRPPETSRPSTRRRAQDDLSDARIHASIEVSMPDQALARPGRGGGPPTSAWMTAASPSAMADASGPSRPPLQDRVMVAAPAASRPSVVGTTSAPVGPGNKKPPVYPGPLSPSPTRNTEAPHRSSGVGREPHAGAAPEVHIHIGRIELTAAAPAAAERRPAPVGHKPLSLETYLRHRRRTPP